MPHNDQSAFPPPELVPMRAAWTRPVTFFHPVVYRCLERQFVDAFLNDGELRLSSFANFRKHKDEERGDNEEGAAMSIGRDQVRQRDLAVYTTVGQNAYVLSTMLQPTTELLSVLGGDCFEIANVDSFACMVGNEIPGCTQIMTGFCLYGDHRITLKSGIDLPPDRLNDDEDPSKQSLDKMLAATRVITGPRQYFMKHFKHRHQVEYRFIWETNKPAATHLNIKLGKAAPDFCRRFQLG